MFRTAVVIAMTLFDLFSFWFPFWRTTPMPSITTEQIAQLQALVGTLVADKATADQATADSNAAHAALQTAQIDAGLKDAAEATADGALSTDVAQLQSFIDALAGPPPGP